jgi:hypothetical protein
MFGIRIFGFSRLLGKPKDWNDEEGSCSSLAIRDIDTTSGPGMESAWEPTPEELAKLNRGAPVILGVLGTVHPPVWLRVGEPPNEGD